jgi:hypothetical protein
VLSTSSCLSKAAWLLSLPTPLHALIFFNFYYQVSERLHMADEFILEYDGHSIHQSGHSATLASLGLK